MLKAAEDSQKKNRNICFPRHWI